MFSVRNGVFDPEVASGDDFTEANWRLGGARFTSSAIFISFPYHNSAKEHLLFAIASVITLRASKTMSPSAHPVDTSSEVTAASTARPLSAATQAIHADDHLNRAEDVAPAMHVSTTFRYASKPEDLVPAKDLDVS